MARASLLAVTIAAAMCGTVTAGAVNFRGTGQLMMSDIRSDLYDEMALSDRDLATYEDGLRHMFVSMPKNAHSNLGHQAVRRALHRFFVHRHGWWLRGFDSDFSDGEHSISDKDRVPELLQEAFESVNTDKGADLHALAALAASIESLVERETRAHLRDCFAAEQVAPTAAIDREVAQGIAHTYFMSFILEHNWTVDDKKDLHLKNKIFEERYPLYKNASEWLGKVFEQELGVQQSINFNQTLKVASRIGEQYRDLNDAECVDLRAVLQGMESKKPGRIRLSVFYNMSIHTHWKFTESVDTLRNLGALDDADPQQKYVLIPNYALSRPNCVNASNIYDICCANTCEKIMSHIEKDVGDSVATVERIAELVSSLASESVAAPRILSDALRTRLAEVASAHGGHVALHGRLFKQWLHHAYPLECPYPQVAGTTNPQAWTGDDSDQATDEEMRQHVEADVCRIDFNGKVDCGEEASDLPWSTAEELLIIGPVGPPMRPQAANALAEPHLELATGLGLLLAALLALVVARSAGASDEKRSLRVPGVLALAGLASCLGLLDPTVAVIGAVGGVAANFAAHRAKACQPGLPTTVKCV